MHLGKTRPHAPMEPESAMGHAKAKAIKSERAMKAKRGTRLFFLLLCSSSSFSPSFSSSAPLLLPLLLLLLLLLLPLLPLLPLLHLPLLPLLPLPLLLLLLLLLSLLLLLPLLLLLLPLLFFCFCCFLLQKMGKS